MPAEGYDLDRMKAATGFDKLKALKEAKELINTNDETRKVRNKKQAPILEDHPEGHKCPTAELLSIVV